MAAYHARSRRTSSLTLVLLFLALVFYFTRPISLAPAIPQRQRFEKSALNRTAVDPLKPSQEIVGFWRELIYTIRQSPPGLEEIHIQGGQPDDEEMDPNGVDTQRVDRVILSGSNIARLKNSHAEVVARIKQLSRDMPYHRGERGVVITATGNDVGVAITSILMLRRTGSQLPVQLFLSSEEDYKKNQALCEGIFPALKTECLILDKILETTPEEIDVDDYQHKIFAILFSTFQEVLSLSPDTFPIQNPDYLFDLDPYRSAGMVTWPDSWLSTASREFFDIAGARSPRALERRGADSSIMLYNKASHARSIMLAAYYNIYGPGVYYPLLQQGAAAAIAEVERSDRDTYVHAAAALGEDFYDVRTGAARGGRRLNGTREEVMSKHANPVEDYRLFRKGGGAEAKELRKGMKSVTSDGREVRARTMFIKHDGVRLDIKHPLTALSALFDVDVDGRYARLWGDETELNEEAGFDVEKGLWEEFIDADCASTFLSDECEHLERWLVEVFYTI